MRFVSKLVCFTRCTTVVVVGAVGLVGLVLNFHEHHWLGGLAISVTAIAAASSLALGLADTWQEEWWKLCVAVALVLSVLSIFHDELPEVSARQAAVSDLNATTTDAVAQLEHRAHNADTYTDINRADSTCQFANVSMGGIADAVLDSAKTLYFGPIATMVDLVISQKNPKPVAGQDCYAAYLKVRAKYPDFVMETSDRAKSVYSGTHK